MTESMTECRGIRSLKKLLSEPLSRRGAFNSHNAATHRATPSFIDVDLLAHTQTRAHAHTHWIRSSLNLAHSAQSVPDHKSRAVTLNSRLLPVSQTRPCEKKKNKKNTEV